MQLLRTIFLLFVILMFLPTYAQSEETYRFEQMWPTLNQPWYFYQPLGVAVDQNA